VKRGRDLTQGSLFGHLMHMSLPTMVGFFIQAFYDIVDMIWIGKISYQAVAAVTIFINIFWVVEVLNEIVGMGSVSLLSQSYGAKNHRRTQRVAEQTLAFKFTIACAASVLLLVVLRPLIAAFSDDADVQNYALSYGYIRGAFIPLFFTSYSINTIFRNTGNAKFPMYLMGGAGILNIILDPMLMFDTVPLLTPLTGIHGLGLGVSGAAWATAISITLTVIIGAAGLFSGWADVKPRWKGLIEFDREIDRKLITIGIPTGMEMLFRNVSQLVLLKFIALYGTMTVALFGVGIRIYGFILMPIFGLLMGASAIVGQNLGAEQIERARGTAKLTVKMGLLFSSAVTAAVLVFAEQIILWFIPDLENVVKGAVMLRIVIPSLVIASFSIGIGVVFGGSGHTFPYLLACITGRWIVMVPLAALGVFVFKAPVVFIWTTLIIAEIAEAAVMYIEYRKGLWQYKRV